MFCAKDCSTPHLESSPHQMATDAPPAWKMHLLQEAMRRNALEYDPFRMLVRSYQMLRDQQSSSGQQRFSKLNATIQTLTKDNSTLKEELQQLSLASKGVVVKSGRGEGARGEERCFDEPNAADAGTTDQIR